MKRRFSLGALAVGLVACASGAPPALQQPQRVPNAWVILAPQVRVSEGPFDAELGGQLIEELRTQLQARGFGARVEQSGGVTEGARLALLDVVARTRGGAGERLRRGSDLGIGAGLQSLTAAGWESVAVMRLAGYVPEPGRGIPLPPDAVMPNPDNGPDYDVPHGSTFSGNAVALDMLLVSTRDSTVILHRRVAIPTDSRERLTLAVPSLVRECLRGLTP